MKLSPISLSRGAVRASLRSRGGTVLLALFLVLGAARAGAATRSSVGEELAAHLPAGVTFDSATSEQMTVATHDATQADPAAAAQFVRAALLAKSPSPTGGLTRRPERYGDGKSAVVFDHKSAVTESVCPPCNYVMAVSRAAIVAAPSQANSVIEMVGVLCPDCGERLVALYGVNSSIPAGSPGPWWSVQPTAPTVSRDSTPTNPIVGQPPSGVVVTPVANK